MGGVGGKEESKERSGSAREHESLGNLVAKCPDSGTQILALPLISCGVWERYLTSSCIDFLICSVGIETIESFSIRHGNCLAPWPAHSRC